MNAPTQNKLADLLSRVRDFMGSALAEGPHADNLAHYDAEIAAALAEHDAQQQQAATEATP